MYRAMNKVKFLEFVVKKKYTNKESMVNFHNRYILHNNLHK